MGACDENADCANTEGAFTCTCKQGFTGDGIACEGISTIKLSNERLHQLRPILFSFVHIRY